MTDMLNHLRENADDNGNLWCLCEGCVGTYTLYRINTWGLRNTAANKEDGTWLSNRSTMFSATSRRPTPSPKRRCDGGFGHAICCTIVLG